MTSIYLDYNATAPLRPEVIARVHALLAQPMNASSVHAFGREAKKILEYSRASIAQVISCFPNEIVFCASATEANNWVLRAFTDKTVLVSATDHPSVIRNPSITIPVDEHGAIKLAALSELLAQHSPALVSVMLANNETGVIQDIAAISALCRDYNALLHVDAVQALGKISVDCGLLGADFMTLSGHKCGGPIGAAALVARGKTALPPMMLGGGQELRKRAGTENVAAIAGFALAAELSQDFLHMKLLAAWRDEMEAAMRKLGAVVHGKVAKRLPNTSCVSLPGVSQEVQLMRLDLAGMAVSAGSACSSGRIEPSHVLLAMGVSRELAGSAIRISTGWATHEQDVQQLTTHYLSLPAHQ